MSDCKITLIGLNKYLSYENKSLFDYLTLPDGIDKDTLCSNILQRGSEFEVQYADADYMRESVGVWGKKWYWTFARWVRAINVEYAPLENYDRYEDWTDNNTHNDTTNNTHSDTDSINSNRDIVGEENENINSTLNTSKNATENTLNNMTTHETSEHSKSAYDSGGYSPYEKTDRDATSNNTINTTSNETGNNTNAETDTRTHNENDKYTEGRNNTGQYENVNTGDSENVHTGHLHGNIGVTSSQDMLQQEIDIAYFNLYERITDIFLTEYTIPIYI